MNVVESSYEGAVRRMQALGHRVHDSSLSETRMRELEELAMIACDQNERLEAEVAALREEKVALQRKVAMLEAVIADPRAVLGLPDLSSSLTTAPREAVGPRRRLALPVSVVVGLAALTAGVLGVRTQVRELGTAMRLGGFVAAAASPIAAAIARVSRPHPRFGRADLDLTMPVFASAPSAPIAAAAAAPERSRPAVAAPERRADRHGGKKHRSRHASRGQKKPARVSLGLEL